jgi:16S rRNA (cytosine1402-N4)-methyltransferase
MDMIENDKQLHKTVLLKEAVEALNIKKGDVIVDATLGAGGHTLKIIEEVGAEGKVVALDLDRRAIQEFISRNNFTIEKKRGKGEIYIIKEKSLILVHKNFKNIKKIIQDLYSTGDLNGDQVNGILADLGWRIEQVQNKDYGMSFQDEAPLDMRFNLEDNSLTAQKIVNGWSARELENIFRELGEESFARQIARAIVTERENKSIETTKELADLIATIKFKRNGRLNPATKVFQALRIAVNEEFSNLNKFLESSIDILENKGYLVIISFHSLEDRLVKNFFRTKARGCVCPKEIPVCTCRQEREVKIISSRAIKASKGELRLNPRARSASLRIAQKIK